MKIIYCPPGQDPMELARKATRQKRGGVLNENWWVPLAVVGFLAVGVTVGPLKGCWPQKTETPQMGQSVESVIAAPVVTPIPQVFCNLPMGGMILNGDAAWVDWQSKIVRYRCNNGQLAEIEAAP